MKRLAIAVLFAVNSLGLQFASAQEEGGGGSSSARSGRLGGAELGYGLIIGAIPGMQFHGYYNINPNFSVGLLYNSGTFDVTPLIDDNGTATLNKADLNGSIIGVNARYFTGNSFYVSGALAQRNVAFDIDIDSTVIDYGLEGDITANTIGLVLAIGNQWQWSSGLSVGVEWLGYTLPLTSSSESSLDETGAFAGVSSDQTASVDSLRDDSEDVADTLGKLGTPRLLVVSVGWAF